MENTNKIVKSPRVLVDRVVKHVVGQVKCEGKNNEAMFFHKEMEKIIRISRKGGAMYYNIMRRAIRRLMKDYNINLANHRDIGYKVTTGGRTIEDAERKGEAAIRKTKIQSDVLKTITPKEYENMPPKGQSSYTRQRNFTGIVLSLSTKPAQKKLEEEDKGGVTRDLNPQELVKKLLS